MSFRLWLSLLRFQTESRQAKGRASDGVTDSLGQRVLGIDPGLNITGYAVVEKKGSSTVICEAGVVRSKRRGSLESRLAEIFEGVRDVIASFHPASVAVEEIFSHYERPRTAILMGHARGVICLASSLAGIPVQHYAATQVKQLLTGSGRAPKSQIQAAVCREFGLTEVPSPPDVADALAIAVCHLHHTNTTLNLT